MNTPKFITFTGADAWTDHEAMSDLAAAYPIEWGILFSPDRQGVQNRYPDFPTVRRLLDVVSDKTTFSAHLCGRHARAVINYGMSELDDIVRANFLRAQINTADPDAHPTRVAAWALRLYATGILQCRGPFPEANYRGVEYLFDASGGRGIVPPAWPAHPAGGGLAGFAGGISPENAAEVVRQISETSAGEYWIDMESGVRDEQDRFSIAKCRQVCEAVYGRPS